MPDSPTSEPESGFVCDFHNSWNSACAGEPVYKEHEGKRYCVLHYPGKDKGAAFQTAFRRKLDSKDFNFRGVWFPDKQTLTGFVFSADADFSCAVFKAEADFGAAKFKAEADFGAAKFCAEADFFGTEFDKKANFVSAIFSARAFFREVTFSAEAYFSLATFGGEADFIHATFSRRALFNQASFADYVSFAGNERRVAFSDSSSLELQFARIEKPDQVSFRALTLHPDSFVNVDAHEFDFTNVDWDWRRIDEEIEAPVRRVPFPQSLRAIACRRLAINAEENHRYEEASRFRYKAMDALRRERWRGFAFWKLSWWYWLASGYGERVLRAFLVLIGLCAVFATVYLITGHLNISDPKGSKEYAKAILGAFNYSLQVMTLQRADKPLGILTPILVSLETILGPLQAALLALAIRRKFMR